MSSTFRSLIFHLALLWISSPAAAAQWIEHASNPGPNLPPTGQSRFDDLFLQASGEYSIPYPFADLVDFLNSRLVKAQSASVRKVFIPRGRSLQRESPAPDYFKHSRVVIAMEGEPRVSDNHAGHVLEYRLFIAHQPSTESLEVISYNDEAGRFEFQLVENYAVNQTARVRQANRVMCLSCHQNAAPIFAPNPWTETSFNIEIAKRLIQARPDKHASLIGLFTRDAGLIDVLVERANYLAAAQHIWRYGCMNRTCRAAMLAAVLQYRLSSKASFNWHDSRYRQDYYTELQRNWEKRWPQGLALANSRIPDHNPLVEDTPDFSRDPLFDRKAHASWYQVDSVLARGIIYRLSGFLTLADIRRLDRHLISQQGQTSGESQRFRADCRSAQIRDTSTILVCGDTSNPAGLRARFEIGDVERFATIRPISVQIPGDTNIWQPDIIRHFQAGPQVKMIPGVERSGLSARLSNGDRIVSMTFERRAQELFSLTVEISRESRLLEAAIEKLLKVNAEGLSGGPFRRQVVIGELMYHLNMSTLNWPKRIGPISAPVQYANPLLAGGLELLKPYCAHCHGENSAFPPGFLYGADAMDRIRQCAPRIVSRLQGWQHYPDLQRSPMPPPASLSLSGVTVESWPKSNHYRTLIDAMRELLIESQAETSYEDLPPCLPAP